MSAWPKDELRKLTSVSASSKGGENFLGVSQQVIGIRRDGNMSYEVDVGRVGPITIGEGQQMAVGLVWPGEIAPSQWYRMAISINPSPEENPPGTSLVIVSERFGIQGDGQQFTEFTVLNNGNTGSPFMAAVFTLNVISTPSHQ